MRKLLVLGLVLVCLAVTVQVAQAAIFVTGANTWKFNSREWLLNAAGNDFIRPGPNNSLPAAAGSELIGSFVITSGPPSINYGQANEGLLVGKPELGGVFYDMFVDPNSPLLTGRGSWLFFNPATDGAKIQFSYDDPTLANTHYDATTGASGAAIPGGLAAWKTATNMTDGSPVFAGTFSLLSAADNPLAYAAYVAGGGNAATPVVLIATFTGSTTGAAASGFGYIDIDPLSPLYGDLVQSDTFGPGRDMSISTNVFAKEGIGGPDPLVRLGKGTVPDPFTASGIDVDPVDFDVTVPEATSLITWGLLVAACFGASVIRRRARNG